MKDAPKPQTSVPEQLQLSVGEHGYTTTTPADSNLQLLLQIASFSKSCSISQQRALFTAEPTPHDVRVSVHVSPKQL
jgi:hypothetical protein